MIAPFRLPARKNKFNAVKITIDGVTYASKGEADWFQTLKIRERIGEITDLQRQVRFPLIVNGIPVADYYADAVWFEPGKGRQVADFKGRTTAEASIKMKLFYACYGARVRVFTKAGEKKLRKLIGETKALRNSSTTILISSSSSRSWTACDCITRPPNYLRNQSRRLRRRAIRTDVSPILETRPLKSLAPDWKRCGASATKRT